MNNLWTSCSAQPMSTLVFFVAQDATLVMSCCHIAILLSSRTSSLRSNGITFSFKLFFFFQVPGKKSRKRELRSFSIFHALCVHLSSGVEGFSKGKGGRGGAGLPTVGATTPPKLTAQKEGVTGCALTPSLRFCQQLTWLAGKPVACCLLHLFVSNWHNCGLLLLLLFFVLELHSRML